MEDNYSKTTYFRSYEAGVPASDLVITIFDGTGASREIDLASFGKAVITFGRDPSCDIVINSPLVSRHHGVFKLFAGNICIIEDSGSTNGLIFNGEAIKSRKLQDGDSVRIDDGVETTAVGVLMYVSDGGKKVQWRTFPLAGHSKITIGRNTDCDICLNHVSVSKLHARITIESDGAYITDTNSTNGVSINGKRISGRVKLHEKDLIIITNSQLVYTSTAITYCCFKSGISVNACNVVKKVGKKKLTICDDVSLSINPCELVAIIGGSGAGKSTIMNCISGYSIPTDGRVYVNDTDLYENYDALKSIIGYVPQSDIVYDNLTVFEMLRYTAQLRLPADTNKHEMDDVINKVIAKVELTERSNTLIRNLSGGQRKRASIAVELISDPNLLFLDEPASGLDPGTERNLMKTLKNMAVCGKTVVLVTHSTLNLSMCDKIVFMGKGGKLCFCGTYDEALSFFGVSDVVDIYNMITDSADEWQSKYKSHSKDDGMKVHESKKSAARSTKRKSAMQQLPILIRRYFRLVLADKQRLILILLQAPLLAMLISLVADGEQFVQYEMTKSLLFALSCSAFWIGTLNSIQEICKERNILRREYMTGLRLGAYVTSKMAVLGILCAVQSLLICVVFATLVGMPCGVLGINAFIELYATTFLTAMAASAMGILVSSLFKNADRAMTVAPLLLMPQLLFSGMIFTLEGATESISYAAVCRWSMECFGTSANLNSLDLQLQQTGLPIEHTYESFYKFTSAHMIKTWLILLAFIVVLPIVAMLILRGINNERK